MQHGLGDCTHGGVRSGRGASQRLTGQNDASGVAHARGNLGADREGRAPKKSVVGLDWIISTDLGSWRRAPRYLPSDELITNSDSSSIELT
jgi:hypothetical protein